MNTMLQRKPQAALRLSSLSDEDKRRLSRVISWVQEELGHNNTQMARLLGCAPSSLGCFLNQERNKVHINFLEKLASIVGISVESLQDLIHKDSGWSLTHRITVLRSKYKDTHIERNDIKLVESNDDNDPLASIAKEMLSLPVEALPQVIEMAVARLKAAAIEKIDALPQTIDAAVQQLAAVATSKKTTLSSKGGSSMSDNNFLKKRERTMISLLVWISWQERKKRGEEIKFEEDSLLATFVYSQGRDFLSVDGVFSVNECARYELDEIAQFCFKAKWEKNTPRICKMESYASWDELMDSISSVNGAFSLC